MTIDRSTILGFCAILLWSTTVALGRSISERIGPLAGGAAIFLTAGAILTGQLLLKNRSVAMLRTLPLKYAWGCGALFLVCNLSLYLAIGLAADRNQSIVAGMINYLWPSLTILFSLVILGKKAGGWLVPGTVAAFSGICLVLAQGNGISWTAITTGLLSNPAAYGLALTAAVSWALYSNFARRWGGPGSDGAVAPFMLATGLAFLLMRLFHFQGGSPGVQVIAEIAALGLATALGYSFWDIAMRKGNMMLVASCSYLIPFFSTVVSSLYLRILPGAALWLGCILIIAGSFVSWRAMEGRSAAVTRMMASSRPGD